MNFEIGMVLAVLGIVIVLFATEALRVDVIAIAIMVTLPWLGLVSPTEAFSGLASNAVVAVMAVMIISYGIDRSGIMSRITQPILRLAGNSEHRIVALVGATVGLISAFLQNIGAAALFLPAMLRISKRTGLPVSRLLMPMGFAAILGGTLTLVGSGPLIILNDLLHQGGQQPYGLFSVTPIGLTLLAGGIVYFLLLGKVVLPTSSETRPDSTPQHDLIETWKLPRTIRRYGIPEGSPLIGQTRESAALWQQYGLHLLSLTEGDDVIHAPWRFTPFAAGQQLALLGEDEDIRRLVDTYDLQSVQTAADGQSAADTDGAGFAEMIIPPRSPIAGRTMREIALRKTYGVEPIMRLSGQREQQTDFSDEPLLVGDALIVYGPDDHIRTMADNRTFFSITPVPEGRAEQPRPLLALLCAFSAVTLALLGAPLSVSLFSGALAMILFKIVPIDAAYQAIDWRTVFLLAGLIPLGVAMEKTGGAAYVADRLMQILEGGHPILILAGIALLSTLFSLFMSNVAAAVLLVPLVVLIGESTGMPARPLALLVAVCASNAFLLPTHQVNALLMGTGGYRNADYLRAGGLMSLLFIVIAVGLIYVFYL